jgi:hypothetical protein
MLKSCLAFIFVILAFGGGVQAAHIEGNLFYLSDSLTASSTETTASRILGDVALMINLTKKGGITVGWSYNYVSATDSAATEQSFSLTEMGPKFGFFFDKAKEWGLGLAYHLLSDATYDDDGTQVTWEGNSYKAEIGYAPAFGESFRAGVYLNYYQANFSEQLDSSENFSTVSNSRSIIYPSIHFSYNFSD